MPPSALDQLGKYITTIYNTVHYNTVLDITQFKDGSQKCIDYIDHLWSFFNIIYTFLFGYNTVVYLTQFMLWTPTIVL